MDDGDLKHPKADFVPAPLSADEITALREMLADRGCVARVQPRRPHIAPRLDSARGIDTLLLAPWDAGIAVMALIRCGVPFSLRAGVIPAQEHPPQTVAEMTSWPWEDKGFVELRGPGDEMRYVLDRIQADGETRLQEEFAFRLAQSADEAKVQ